MTRQSLHRNRKIETERGEIVVTGFAGSTMTGA
jgi:hypothetical protein